MADGPSTGHDDFLSREVEESQSSEAIKVETQKILSESKKIKSNSTNPDVEKEYDNVRLATVGALKELQLSTSQSLGDFRNELTSQDDTLSSGVITQEELSVIKEEFSDLQQLSNEGDSNIETPEAGIFGSLMLGYIESTNEKILNGGENEINSQILWYITVFGGENGITLSGDSMGYLSANTAYIGALAVLSSETMNSSISRLEQIKNSSYNLETKLFQLSQVLYEVGKEAGAPAELETAHNLATQTIIQKVIENSNNTFAVGFNESTGYYTTENISSTSSELEIGTYLCSLNKNGKLTKENLLRPSGIFSPTELFVILEQYKNGNFGGENIQGLFNGYLEGFYENMTTIAQEYLKDEMDGEKVINFFNAQTRAGDNTTLYNPDDIPNLTKITGDYNLNTLQNSKLKEDIIKERARTIGERLKQYMNNTYAGGPDMLDVVNAIIDYTVDSEGGNENLFDFSGINEIIQEYNEKNYTYYPLISENFKNKISSIFTASALEESYTASIDTFAEIDTEIKDLFSKLQKLQVKLSQLKLMGEYEIIEGIQQEIDEINLKIQILRGKKQKMEYIVQNIDFDAYTDMENFTYDFDNEAVVQFLLENKKYIKYIPNIDDILTLIEKSGNTIKPYEIHQNLQTDLRVLRALGGNITVYDTYRMPDSFFTFQEEGNNYGKVFVLLSNIRGGYSTMIDKFIKNNSTQERQELAQILYLIIQDNSGNLSSYRKNWIKLNFLKKEGLMVFLNSEQKENLGYQTPILENEEDAKEKFISVTEKMFNVGYEDGDSDSKKGDISTVITYLETYGFIEVKSQFSRLIKNKRLISTSQLSGIISTIPYNNGDGTVWENSMKIVQDGVTSRGVDMIKPLSDDFKSHPTIIKQTLDITPKNQWAEVLSYMHIIDAKGVLALYKSTNNSIDDTAKYLEYTNINPDVLNDIIRSTNGDDLEIIGSIINRVDGNISIIMGKIQAIKNIQNNISENNSINYVQTFLESYPQITDIDNLKLLLTENNGVINEEIGTIIYEAFSGNKIKIEAFIDGLLNASIQQLSNDLDTQGQIIIGRPIDEKLGNLLERDDQENYIIGNGQQLSDAFQEFLQINQGTNIEELRLNFLLSLGVSEEDLSYIVISTWLKDSEQITILIEQQERIEEISDAITQQDWERLNVINKSIRDAYAKGEILYSYDEINDILNPQDIPSNVPSDLNFSELGLDSTQDTYGRISTELNLTSEEQGSLTKEELTLISSNENVRESFIGFRTTLVELGLTELWKFRNQIFRTIGSLDFNISDGDYIGENELNIFLSKTVYATLQDPRLKNTPSNIDTTKQIIREINQQSGGINDVNAVNTIGEAMTLVENSFRNQFAPRNAGILTFKVGAFKKTLKS